MTDSNFYLVAPSVFGTFSIVWREFSKNPKVYRIILSNKQISAFKLVQNTLPTACQSSNPIILNLVKLIQSFLSGQEVEFDLKLLALETCSEFQRRVRQSLSHSDSLSSSDQIRLQTGRVSGRNGDEELFTQK